MTTWNHLDQRPLTNGSPVVHLYVLLDRSGSMASIADDVIGGFNRLIADQRADGDDAVVTLVQFDSEDVHEVVTNATPVGQVPPLDGATFVPRGATPLLDATGQLLARAAQRVEYLEIAGKPAEDIVFVSITDGHENSSRELSLSQIRRAVEHRTKQGWTFVFLSAALDVYGESHAMGYDARSAQAFAPDPRGIDLAMDALSTSMRNHRQKVRSGTSFDRGDFFEGEKVAEADRRGKEAR